MMPTNADHFRHLRAASHLRRELKTVRAPVNWQGERRKTSTGMDMP
jgi:hypothetical protein